MAITPTVVTSGSIVNTSSYGTAMKEIVAFMLANDSNLSLASVVSDTTSKYQAYISIAGSNQGFYIYNSNDSVYFYTAYKTSSGTWTSYSGENMTGFLAVNYQHCTGVADFGNCYGQFFFMSTYSASVKVLKYAIFSSDTTDGTFVTVSYGSVTGSYPELPAYSGLPSQYYDATRSTFDSIYFVDAFSTFTPMIRAGQTYCWVPYKTSAYNNNKGFLNIAYGGAYIIYALYNAAGQLVTAPAGKQVTVDGETITSVGMILKAVAR